MVPSNFQSRMEVLESDMLLNLLLSAAACSDLISIILPSHLSNISNPHLDVARSLWSKDNTIPAPEGTGQHRQKAWDSIKVSATFTKLLEDSSDEKSHARLLVAFSPESGAWLNAPPCFSLGLHLDNDTIQVAVGLRLGKSICKPHKFHHCDAEVDSHGTHGLSCKWSERRHFCLAAINDIIYRALSAAKIPSRLEPSGTYRSDGKRPDGITMIPSECGKLLVWDATCSNTFVPSYITSASTEAGTVAILAEERKTHKYCDPATAHIFQPVAVETAGTFGPATFKFLKSLAKRTGSIRRGQVNSYSYLVQDGQ